MKNAKLVEMMKYQDMVIVPGCHDALGAKIIEKSGYEAVYMTGNGLSASLIGAPDIGLLTMTEMVERARYFSEAVNIPIIADGDTGYGNVNNVRRTIHSYEDAGVSAVHLEDQVTPKRCGAMKGINLISPEEHAEKIRVACETRVDKNFLIIGRTDARIKNGFSDALYRGQVYADAGADLILLEMLQSADEIREAVKKINAPIMFNYVEGKTPPLKGSEFKNIGVKILCFPISSTLAYAQMMKQFLKSISDNGGTSCVDMMTINEYEGVLDISDYL
ncbi:MULTISPECIES: isocitrate lyase/PEP mutase family protein [unclassified Serratia (in: enterobacteria)]|uniref:isocitrate lyase/PEP mutase family protein n=1 Tax=unclassified Serratia (in: enterobacteria) TaxID=2647522 RepID=UPI000CB44663|nr:carboxyvinyl-carboxyphosphonate phosphorylmutase [Serratia ureilytica]